MEYSFCETIVAYVWHIRPLTGVGRKLNGGAYTTALCGAKVVWDIGSPINLSPPLDGLCRRCAEIYQTVHPY